MKSVLLIDDDAIINIVNSKYLEKSGYFTSVKYVNTASRALSELTEKFEHGQSVPDLILLDIMMPVMNGFTFLTKFALMPVELKDQIKIVMLSSSMDPRDRSLAFESPYVVDYMDKPLDHAKVKHLINLL